MLNDYKGLKHLKSMNIDELRVFAETLRVEIIDAVSKNGGHLASSLGAVELAMALHYVFDSPQDSIIWDVGHQAYPHKILTGRNLDNLRKKGGISGFPKPDESEHDPFIAGHSGISISQATGLAVNRPHNFSIAVIGDGSMTSGVAYEAMNHAGHLNLSNLIVVLNDNEMSISKNVGGIASYISNNIVNSAYYQKLRTDIKNLISAVPFQKELNIDLVSIMKRVRSSAVNLISPDAFFETFGFRYVGPFDGNDLEILVKAFTNIPLEDKSSSPLLFHIITKKGKGYSYAEEDPSIFHGISCFDKKTGGIRSGTKTSTFTQVFGRKLCELAEKNEKVCVVTAAMKEGTGLEDFSNRFPKRFYDVGIAEQHAISFAVGMAKTGLKPVVAIYSTFMQRAYDQVIHDMALNNLHVVCCMDRAGLVGEDGATHHGIFDISFLRCVPNITFMSPSTETEFNKMLEYSVSSCEGPVFIRYPRGCVPDWEINKENSEPISRGKARKIFHNGKSVKQISIISLGVSSYIAKLAVEELVKQDPELSISIYDARFIKPVDEETFVELAKNSSAIVTLEENVLAGGFGSAVLETITDVLKICPCSFYRLGITDSFIEHGTQTELRVATGLDVKTLCDLIKKIK